MTQTINITIAIPTYNGAHRLPTLLQLLQNQVNTEHITWEIIVVDNNSTDDTAKIVHEYQQNWRHPFPLKYCLETQQGAAYARKRAVFEAQGQLIGFLDDDNYPEPDWVFSAYTFSTQYPKCGAYASLIHPAWEVEPPPNFKRITPFLAITERGDIPLLYDKRKKMLPPSAGLVVRKQAWIECIPENPILTGRANGNMLTGEDTEMLSYIQKAGWEIWYNPAMEIHHQIPHWRLQKEYLLPFFRGIGLSRYVTRMVNIKPHLRPFACFAYMMNDLRKILTHLIKYRRSVKTELVAACEMQLFVSSLISPFYLWRNGYLQRIQRM
jgi:glycosyltransferase involved in cell wall biosynthesis